MTQPQPAELIATLGSEPQVVTSTLDLLLARGNHIQRVSVLHTHFPGSPIEAAVLDLQNAVRDYPDSIHFHFSALTGDDGAPLGDVETEAAALAGFRALYNLVRTAKLAGRAVHLCIAGGRKTLSIFGMLAAQLLFDEEDCLWHLFSSGDFLSSRRLHPKQGDDVHLILIPVVHWSRISPLLLDFDTIDDPLLALERQKKLRLVEKLEDIRSFVRGSLTQAEERVCALLVRDGLSDQEIASRLVLSPRTVEQHLRAVYMKAENHWELPVVKRAQLVALLSLYYTLADPTSPEGEELEHRSGSKKVLN